MRLANAATIITIAATASLLSLGLLSPAKAHARSFELRTITVGQATQYMRSDLSIEAPRRFDQTLSLRAFDLLDDQSGSLNAQLMFRYATDLGLEPALRQDPAFLTQSSAASLDIAYLQWRALPWLALTVGRQWSLSALGMGDFDGLKLNMRARQGQLKPALELWAGQATQANQGFWAPDSFDLQGLPQADERFSRAGSVIIGGRAALAYEDHLRLETSYQRQWSYVQAAPGSVRGQWVEAQERVGAALQFNPTAQLNVSTSAAYHLLLQTLTQGRVDAAYRPAALPWLTLNAGASRRKPWFDASSIFNIFDPQPHDDLYGTLMLTSPSALSRLELRLWRRAFYADEDEAKPWGALTQAEGQANATGVGLSASTRQELAQRLIELRANASYQAGDEGSGGDQLLLDTSAKAPAFIRGLFLNARLLGLVAWQPRTHLYPSQERALSALAGIDYPVLERGTLSATVEQRFSTNLPTTTIAYMSLSLEVWP